MDGGDESGLLCRVSGGWLFSEGDPKLLFAAAWPLHQLLPSTLCSLFTEADPWRQRPALERLASALGSTSDGDSQVGEPDREARSDGHAPSCSQLRVRATQRAGRGLHAHGAVARGALLLSEDAHSAVLWPEAATTHCAWCFAPLSSGWLACDDARGRPRRCCERYCSSACAEAAWHAGHAAECGTLYHRLVAPRTVILALRALLRPSAATGRAEAHATTDHLGHLSHGGLEGILGLHDHGDEMSAARRSQLRFHAYLAGATVWRRRQRGDGQRDDHDGSSGDDTRVERLIYRLLRLALTNVFSVSRLAADTALATSSSASPSAAAAARAETLESLEALKIGEALFARASLSNHACAPNTSLRFDGKRLELRAARHLQPGEEVTTSYGPQAGFAPLAQRRATLRTLYYFECRCAACAAEARGAGAAAAASSASAEELRQRAQSLDVAARDACERGCYAEAATLVERALGLLRRAFPAGSSVLAHEEAKAARLRFNAEADEAAAAALRLAAASLEACFGAEYEEVRELRRLEGMCTAR